MAKRLFISIIGHNGVKEVKELLNTRPIQEERGALQFWREGWCEQAEAKEQLNHVLCSIIELSKRNKSVTQASANAATLLALIGFSFSGMDLSYVQLRGADLSNSILSSTCLYNADL